jgi:fumarate reductase (CoM/CoB) subunit B
MNKPTEQEKIQAENILEEVQEILAPCIRCGMCKEICPVFKILRKEPISPRGQAIVLSEKVLDEIIFECNLCKACEEKCPLNVKVCDAIKKAREAAVLKGKELKQNKEMIKNVRKTGNPFGENPEESDKLYCC